MQVKGDKTHGLLQSRHTHSKVNHISLTIKFPALFDTGKPLVLSHGMAAGAGEMATRSPVCLHRSYHFEQELDEEVSH